MPSFARNKTCSPRTLTQPCNWRDDPQLLGSTLLSLPTISVDADFPYPCALGIVGSSDPRQQTSVLCAGYCPPGKLCNQSATTHPYDCPIGHYCPWGSSVPLPCPPGYFGNATGLGSKGECPTCPPGAWCSGGQLIPCATDTYNGLGGSSEQGACKQCPVFANTDGQNSSTSLQDCKCDVGYYDRSNSSSRMQCHPCPVGTICNREGIKLASLPLQVGYFRMSNTSIDIRRCPDATYGCGSLGDDNCTSACQGGPVAPGCHETLTGAFCLSCTSPDGHYYASASATEIARCHDCGNEGGMYLGIISGAIASMVVIGSFVWQMRQRRYMRRALIRCKVLWVVLRFRAKLLLAFYQVISKIPYIYEVTLPSSVRNLVNFLEFWTSLGFQHYAERLTCIGLPHGFMMQLVFWMIVPFGLMSIVLIDAFVRISRRGGSGAASWCARLEEAMLEATPMMLWVAFFAYSIVATTAFDAFTCYNFGTDDSWLRADVSVRCGSDEHNAIKGVAWLAIATWPIGATIAAFVLSFLAHADAIYHNPKLSRPRLRHAISFLHSEYKPQFWWWEPLPMILRLSLVGFFVLLEPGSITQLVLGMLTAFAFLLVQMQVSPYAHKLDAYLALSCNASLAIFFLCCIIFQVKGNP